MIDERHDSPESLRRFVAASRAQPPVRTSVTAEAVAAELELVRGRTHTRRVVLLSAAVAVAASLFVVGLVVPLLSSSGVRSSGVGAVAGLDNSDPSVGPVVAPPVVPAIAPELAPAVRMQSTAAVEIRGPWAIRLDQGTHTIDLDADAGHALRIELADRTLELVEGAVTVAISADHTAAVRLHTGVAAWVDASGARTEISVEHLDTIVPSGSELDPRPQPSSAAAALAREAERQLAAGDSSAAIASYRQLIRKFPRASQSRGAVLDLARLLRAAGRKDEARCAYRIYLERWPDSAVQGDVEAQLGRLGDGPACDGLEPR